MHIIRTFTTHKSTLMHIHSQHTHTIKLKTHHHDNNDRPSPIPPSPSPNDSSSRDPLQTVFVVLAVCVGIAFIGVMVFAVLREKSRRKSNLLRGSSVPRANRTHGGGLVRVADEGCDERVITMETDEEGISSRAVSDFAKLFSGENNTEVKSIRNRTRSGSGSNNKRRPLLSQE